MRYILLLIFGVSLCGCKTDPSKYVITETIHHVEDDFNFVVDSRYCIPDLVVPPNGNLAIHPTGPVSPVVPEVNPPIIETPVPMPSELLEPEMKLEITVTKLKATVYTTDNCPPCIALKKSYGNGNAKINIEYKHNEWPNNGPAGGYPTVRWVDIGGRVRWPLDASGNYSNPKTLDDLVDLIERNNKPSPPKSRIRRVSRPPSVLFGYQPWFEMDTGRTSVQHLISEHHLTREQLAPYIGNQQALNLIHGWKHTGKGYAPPNAVTDEYEVEMEEVESESQVMEKRGNAKGVVGNLQAKSHILKAQDWIRTNIGENNQMEFDWDRTGAQTFPLLKGGDWSAVRLFGKSGHIRLSVKGNTKLPTDSIGIRYEVDGHDMTFGIDPITFPGLADKITPNSNSQLASTSFSSQEKVGFIDPLTLWTVFSVLKNIWSLLHPTADLTLGGNIAATGVLKGDMLAIDFSEMPQLKIVILFSFNLGVRRVEITPSSVRLLFNGSMFIKERTFNVTLQRIQHGYHTCQSSFPNCVSTRSRLYRGSAVLSSLNRTNSRTLQRLDSGCLKSASSASPHWTAA